MYDINTFTVGFDNKNLDESSKARKIAQYLETKHFEVRMNSKQAIDSINEVLEYNDQPFGDYSQLSASLVYKNISKDFKVVISGDGGDELFGGYKRYYLAKNIWNYKKLFNNPLIMFF